jgi:hypothetical protein
VKQIGSSSTPEHKRCHQQALRRLRDEVNGDPALAWRAAVCRGERRLTELGKQRLDLKSKLRTLEDEAVVVQARLQALLDHSAAGVSAERTLDGAGGSGDREAIALEMLKELKAIWQQDEHALRVHFGLPTSRILHEFNSQGTIRSEGAAPEGDVTRPNSEAAGPGL